MHRDLHLAQTIQPKHRYCMDHNSLEECQCGELQLNKEEMVVVGTWLGVGTYYDRKSWRVRLLKHYRVWRAFVAAQRQLQRPGLSWLVLRASANFWYMAALINNQTRCLCAIQAVPCVTL